MIPNEEKKDWHYLAVKNLSALLPKKASNHEGDFFCLNFLNSFRTENSLNYHEKTCKNKDFCGV